MPSRARTFERTAARDRSLDGIRAIAAIWVFLAHASYSGLMPLPFLNFHGSGRFGVVLFFFLSAFLLSGQLFANPSRIFAWRSWAAYFIRRVFRVLPLYYFVLSVLFVTKLGIFAAKDLESASWINLLQHLSLQRGEGVFWTIVLEMRFYLVLPLLLLTAAATFLKSRFAVPIAIILAFVWIVASQTSAAARHPYCFSLGLGKHAPVFVLGIVTSLVMHHLSLAPPFGRRTQTVLEIAAWVLAAVLIFECMPSVYCGLTTGTSISAFSRTSAEYESFWNIRIPWIGFLLGSFFIAYSSGRGWMRRLLSTRPLTEIGKVSFGFYLIHLQVIDLLSGVLRHSWLPLFLLGGVTFLLATVLYRSIEEPMVRLGKRLSARLEAT